jgi:hypothetical protein
LYPQRFYVREEVASDTRHVLAIGNARVRGNRQSADVVWPRTRRALGSSTATNNLWPRTVHEHVMATGRARTWTVHSFVQSTDLDRPCPRSVRNLVQLTDYACPRTLHVPDLERTWTVHRQASQRASTVRKQSTVLNCPRRRSCRGQLGNVHQMSTAPQMVGFIISREFPR